MKITVIETVQDAEYFFCSSSNNRQRIIDSGWGICVFYVELDVKRNTPQTLCNEIEVYINRKAQKKIKLLAATIPIKLVQPIVLDFPLDMGLWTAVYDPAWLKGHRRVFYGDNNVNYLPGRFLAQHPGKGFNNDL